MDYLYGDLSDAERSLFEAELARNPALQRELAELQEGRDLLSGLSDVEPAVPPAVRPIARRRTLRWWQPLAVAASLLLLLRMVDFRVAQTDAGWLVAFGEPTPLANTEQYATLTQVQQLLAAQAAERQTALANLDAAWQQQLTENRQSQEAQLNAQLAAYRQSQRQTRNQLLDQFRQNELPALAATVQDLLNQQQSETEALLTQVWDNWQETRSNDLTNIQSEFTRVYENQTETESLLLDVIQTTGDD